MQGEGRRHDSFFIQLVQENNSGIFIVLFRSHNLVFRSAGIFIVDFV